MRVDACVVGAGPAGLSAAALLAERGLDVVMLDEAAEAGGRLLGQLHRVGHRNDEYHEQGWWNGRKIARRLQDAAENAGARILLGRSVWGIFPSWQVYVSGAEPEMIEADTVLLATGAREVPVPIAGWTLPGVMSIGAAQVMVTQYRVRPGNRVLIAGINVLSMAIARELQLGGVEVAGIVNFPREILDEADTRPARVIEELASAAHLAPARHLRVMGSIARLPGLSRLGARILPSRGLRVWGIPVQPRQALLAIRGDNEVESALIGTQHDGERPSKVREVPVDTVCIAGGLRPLSELAMLAGCQLEDLPDLGGLVPRYSPSLETTQMGLYVAGSISGVESAAVAIAQGRVAAAAIAAPERLAEMKAAEELARENTPIEFISGIHEGRREAERRWAKNGREQPATETTPTPLPAPCNAHLPLDDDVILCRCEEVTVAKLKESFALGLATTEELKRFSRMTMGHCQGRVCQGILRRSARVLLGHKGEVAPAPGHRPPVRPVTMEDLAAYAKGDEERERLRGNLTPELPFDP